MHDAAAPPMVTAIRRVDVDGALQHHPYFYVPCYDDRMERLFFVSHRTGTPQIFVERRSDGRVLQVTQRSDLNEWSLHPSHDGRYVYYTAGPLACRTRLDDLREEIIADFDAAPMLAGGTVGDAMGVTSLSRDDAWWAVPVREQSAARLFVIDTRNGEKTCVVEAPRAFHPEFHPDDPEWLRYSGPHDARAWVVRRDGSENRLVYRRDAGRKEWVVHETWIPGTRDLLVVDWPRGLFRLDVDTQRRTEVSSLNAWHPVTDRTGSWIVADTRNPDRGICLIDLRRSYGEYSVACWSGASNQGDHWDVRHCPYDDAPLAPRAPQHTHPHPQLSPDGQRIVFTTDAGGTPAVFEARLDRPLAR